MQFRHFPNARTAILGSADCPTRCAKTSMASLRVIAAPRKSRRFHYDAPQRGRRQFPEDGTVGRGETTKLREFKASSNFSDASGCRIGSL
jgi:hypothetical protein